VGGTNWRFLKDDGFAFGKSGHFKKPPPGPVRKQTSIGGPSARTYRAQGHAVSADHAVHGGRLPSQQSSSRVILEQLGITNVAAQVINGLVAAHVHHLENQAPLPAAEVGKLERSEWPANNFASRPARPAVWPHCRHSAGLSRCPLYPQKRTSTGL